MKDTKYMTIDAQLYDYAYIEEKLTRLAAEGWHLETVGRDRADKDDYKLKADISFCVSNTVTATEYYHNSSFLEYGGSPEKALKSAFVSQFDAYAKQKIHHYPTCVFLHRLVRAVISCHQQLLELQNPIPGDREL